MNGDHLIMDLTDEQGRGRETQVQPPKNVWLLFFGIDTDAMAKTHLPSVRLTNMSLRYRREEIRKVGKKGHVATIEIVGVGVRRPAILLVQHVEDDEYHYWVLRPGDEEYGHCDWMLDTFPNAARRNGRERRWLIV
jgi:hypothetical protein